MLEDRAPSPRPAEGGPGRPLRLDELPLEILLLIFDYCHAYDLVRLSAVCARFHAVVRDEAVWHSHGKLSLATNQVSERFRARCNTLLSQRAKWQVSHNWEYGQYQSNLLFAQNTKLMPWMQLTGNILWWAGGNQLCGYLRKKRFSARNKIFQTNTQTDVSRFVVRDNYIYTGHRGGALKFWPKVMRREGNNRYYFYSIQQAHSRDVLAVEEAGEIVLSGSADGVLRAWTSPRSDRSLSNIPLVSLEVSERIWSLSTNPAGTKIAVGSSGLTESPLCLYDTNTFAISDTISHPWRHGAGILDMVWDSPHVFLSCGYDTCVRKWDLRVGKCVGYWADPTDATVYCISSDYNYTMVTGTQFNCKAVLWDQRKPRYVQLYFLNLRRMSSPIYSISFDSSHLYGATDQCMIEVKFSGQPNIKKNYREIMNYEKFICTRPVCN